MKRVSFPITRDNILAEAAGKLVYRKTHYMVLNNGLDWAVVRVFKAGGDALLQPVKRVEIVSLPQDTAFLEKPGMDVQNPSVMVRTAEDMGTGSLVVKGKFEHVSFVHQERTIPLIVFDVVPPNPPKIVELVEAALDTGRIRKAIRVIPRIVDLNELARARNTKYVVFPCYASTLAGLETEENALYLDQAPALKAPLNEVTLVGCDLSRNIFASLYGGEPAFTELCPKKMFHSVSEACLCRCCVIDEGHMIEGNAACVPWGASVGEVEEAIIDLLGLELDQAP